jgi:3-oxocholest-4-en-26-oate---CoA ligase
MSDWILADIWERIARVRPNSPAQIHGKRQFTWQEFDGRASGFAGALVAAGLGHQSKVAQLLYNCPEYLESLYGALKVAMVPVNTNYRYQKRELTYLWDNADVEAVVFHASFGTLIEEIRAQLPGIKAWYCVADGTYPVPSWAIPYEEAVLATVAGPVPVSWRRSGDDLILLYTGGTTGVPKGVMWRQDDLFCLLNKIAEVRYCGDRAGCQIGATLAASKHRPPRLLVGPPLMHGAGLLSTISVLNSGGCVILLEGHRFDPRQALETIQAERATQLSIVGDAFARPIVALLDAEPGRFDISSIWMITSSGMAWSDDVKRGLRRHSSGLMLVDTLGSSEALGVGRARYGVRGESGGSFSLGSEARVIDEDGADVTPGSGRVGLLAVRGRMPLGYYKDPGKTMQTFRTIDGQRYAVPGDYATVEADGLIRLLGRGSLSINTGGEKVFAEEVEELLREHPLVHDAAVLGVPDDLLGEAVVAVVEPSDHGALDVAQLLSFARERIAHYKVPRKVTVATGAIRGDNGKLNYPALRKQVMNNVTDNGTELTGLPEFLSPER